MTTLSRAALAAAMFVCGIAAYGQKINPIQWKLEVEPATAAPGGRVLARLTATMEGDWHVYSVTTPPGGPIPTTIGLAANPVVRAVKLYQPKPERKLDPNFGIETETFGKQVVYLFDVEIGADAPAGPVELVAGARYQACTDKECLPPRRITASTTLSLNPAVRMRPPMIPAGYTEVPATTPGAAKPAPAKRADAAVPPPVSGSGGDASGGLAGFLAVAFGFGLAAIFTPCVFPMIPITMSFFLDRQGAVRQAILFCLGIIVCFTAIGFLVTAALGPFGVVQLGSNPWVNGFIALIFLVFALSLLGAFEITLPSGLLTKLDAASRGGGSAGTLLMGLTFSLTSFACVGPFIGTLLAASVQGGATRPLLGMMAFSAGLALPFFLLALFPSYLKKLPRSGGWMVRVKVVLGFIVLAAMLKYLSSVDQVLQWNVLTRERFLALWFVLFALPGLYLLGWLRMEGIRQDEPVGIGRLLTGAAFLAFSFSLLPGMFGARLGEIDAYVPLAQSTPAAAGGENVAGGPWLKNRLDTALQQAKSENKLVFVAFTGYACTNCHWMKANMFPRPEIAAAVRNMVPVELYTDGTDADSEANQKLQETKFGTVAIPFYAILDADGNAVASFAGATRNMPEFLAFLEKGSNLRAQS